MLSGMKWAARHRALAGMALLALTGPSGLQGQAAIAPVSLRCEGRSYPLDVESAPLFRWNYKGPSGAKIEATRVVVGEWRRELQAPGARIWESEWRSGSQMAETYAGPALQPGATYWWRVEARTDGKTIARSAIARFRAAEPEWQARWIAASWSTERDGAEPDGSRPMPMFRRAFRTQHKPVEAVLRIAGLGQWQAWLDGHAITAQHGLHQDWTDYRKRVAYRSVDLTSILSAGNHVLGIRLGNGMYNVQTTPGRYTKFEGSFGPPKLIAEIRLVYPNGRSELLGSDATWQVARGPVTFSSTYGGEDFDARRLQRGWDRPGFSEQGWEPAQIVEGPGGKLLPAIAPDVMVSVSYPSVRETKPDARRSVYDFGQNFAGVPRIQVEGPAGASLRLTPGELLRPDGSVSQESSGRGMWWTYTLRGDGPEVWEPEFGYYGFRYLQAEWTEPGKPESAKQPRLQRVTGEAFHSDSPTTGHFESSSALLNRIHHLIFTAMENNEVSIFTDCPHREKLGWLEETHLVARGLLFDNDLEALFRSTDANIAEAQAADGRVPTTAPQYAVFGPENAIFDDSPEWGSASILAPWAAFHFYGDRSELIRRYSRMQAWVRYLESRAVDGIVSYGLGDWYDIGPGEPGVSKDTTAGVTGTLMLLECARAMERIAPLTGHTEDAAGYRALGDREVAAFQKRFWDPEHRWYDHGSQTANAMPLALGIVPDQYRSAILGHLVTDIHEHGNHITTGEVGYPYLLRALETGHRNDVALATLLRKDPPSYGAQIEAGATSLTEAWDADSRNSQDHFMLGGAEEWFYRSLGGIDLDLSGDRQIGLTLRPVPVDGVEWVRSGYRSVLGNIESDWKRIATGEVAFQLTVPVGAEATVILPGQIRSSPPTAKRLADENGQTVYVVDGGSWEFRTLLAP